jgi:branched-chain amino acid transport system permease protein
MSLPLLNYLTFTIIFILLGWAVYLPYRCGQLYLAVVYSMATGAYFAAYVTTAWHWPIYLAILGSPLIGAFFAFLPALGLRKAPGFTTAISSLALIFILQTVVRNLKFLGGSAGLFGIPPLDYPVITPFVVIVVVGVIIYRIDHSRLGRAAELLYYSREEAACFGPNMALVGMLMQVLSGALSGIAGALYTFTVGSVFPDAFGFSILLVVFPIVFIGGNLTMWGAAILAPVLWGIPLVLPEAVVDWKDVIYGAILICVLIVRPEGVISKEVVRKVVTGIQSLASTGKRAFR